LTFSVFAAGFEGSVGAARSRFAVFSTAFSAGLAGLFLSSALCTALGEGKSALPIPTSCAAAGIFSAFFAGPPAPPLLRSPFGAISAGPTRSTV